MKTTWTKEKLYEAYKKMENATLGSRLRKVLDWALSNGSFFESENGSEEIPIFGLRGKYNDLFVRFIRKGEIFVYLNEKYTGGKKQRAELISDLKEANLLKLKKNEDPNEIKQGRNLSKLIQDLSDKEFNLMLRIFSKYCI